MAYFFGVRIKWFGRRIAMEKRARKAFLILIFCVAVFLQLLIVSAAAAGGFGQLIHEKDSLYHRIFVYERGSIVTLQFGKRRPGNIQSRVNVSKLRRHMLEYTKLSFCGLLYAPEPERMLMVGLGGGVIPREMHHYFPSLDIDVVEIDPEIPVIARRFFDFREDDKLRVHVADGRMFIKKQLRRNPVPKYDVVILDAFNSDYIPFHLMTKEFLEEVKGVLSEDGVVIANVFYANRLFDAELKTFLAVFGRCQVFFGGKSGNAMLVSPGSTGETLTKREAVGRAKTLQRRHRFDFDLPAVARRLRLETRPDSQSKVLTDDRAPVNWLRKQETGKRF
jgi:spermidine synthase